MGSLRRYKDAVCFVTGGASGIGRALSKELSRRGATVLIGDLQLEMAQEVAQEIRASGGSAEAVLLDVTNFEQFEERIADVFSTYGRLDYLFNNAGVTVIGPFRRFSLEDHRKLVDVNVNGVIHGMHAAYNRMREQGFGHIVNTASVSGIFAAPWFTTYGATKHAVVGLTKNLRLEAEHEKNGVQLSAICPGFINTPMVQGGTFGRLYVEPTEGKQLSERRGMLLPPDTLARKALDGVAKNKLLVIVPGYWRLLWHWVKFFPWLESIAAKRVMNGDFLKETPEQK